MRRLKSLFKLLWIIFRHSACIARAALMREPRMMGVHARLLAEAIHEDLLQLLIAGPRFCLRTVPGSHVRRILLVKLDRIVDMVNTTPVFDALRALFPGAELDLVGHPVSLSLLDGDDRIARRIPYCSWLYHPSPITLPELKTWGLVLALLRRRYSL